MYFSSSVDASHTEYGFAESGVLWLVDAVTLNTVSQSLAYFGSSVDASHTEYGFAESGVLWLVSRCKSH